MLRNQENLKIIEKSDPHDSDEELQTLGNRYIAGLNNLSNQTYQLLHYLHEGRTLKEQKRGIDQAVEFRIQNLKSKIRSKQSLEAKGRRSWLSRPDEVSFDPKVKKALSFPENPSELSEYLEAAHNKIIFESLREGE